MRKIIAKNPNTPPETLTQLAEDEEDWVREKVAANPSTTAEELIKLTEDENLWVRNAASQNSTYLQHRAVQDGICEAGQQMPVEWLKEMYLAT